MNEVLISEEHSEARACSSGADSVAGSWLLGFAAARKVCRRLVVGLRHRKFVILASARVFSLFLINKEKLVYFTVAIFFSGSTGTCSFFSLFFLFLLLFSFRRQCKTYAGRAAFFGS